jgi:hypothetical protein
MTYSRCAVCAEPVEDDGYGEPVHKHTGLYGAYEQPFADPKHGVLTHVAV